MPKPSDDSAAGDHNPRRLFVYNGGFLTQPRIRRILSLAGYDIRLGAPGPQDAVGVWGKSPTAPRGEAVAEHLNRKVIRVEDAFLRSIHPGRSGDPPLGLLIDTHGVHFDSSTPSDIELLLANNPLDDGALIARARDGMGRMKAMQLSKYNDFDPTIAVPEPGYVLVIDQTKGDASIEHGRATASTFREMLVFAQEENPGARVVIKAHPETIAGHRNGHYGTADCNDHISLVDAPVSPWTLMEGAIAVYTVSSQLGFEAIFAGHRPRVFGQPFYSGWGLTVDENPVARRERKLTRAQLFAAAMILAPCWYDPCRDRLCSFEEAMDQLEAELRAFRDDRAGHVAYGMRPWKRAHLQKAFGRHKPLVFASTPSAAITRARAQTRGLLVWGAEWGEAEASGLPLRRVEDGFLRSRGLGAALTPPLSLVADRLGLYYDPTRESDLERLIAAPPPPGGSERAERLIAAITRANLSKYNIDAKPLHDLPADLPADLPTGRRILVPGQVEDDASIRLGAGDIRSNLVLLARVRADNPDAVVIYKPHPDVEAGLRVGALPEADALAHADLVLAGTDPAALIDSVDEVWTITSLLGFEALLRGKAVTCLGTPFYAGWGLTRDLGPAVARRQVRPTLDALVHAALIAYPRYVDPVSNQPCPVEVIVERLAKGEIPPLPTGYRIMSKIQRILAGFSGFGR
ncbi:MAG: capsular polysaccharide biosynthesis protein [Albidovulum sp.]